MCVCVCVGGSDDEIERETGREVTGTEIARDVSASGGTDLVRSLPLPLTPSTGRRRRASGGTAAPRTLNTEDSRSVTDISSMTN